MEQHPTTVKPSGYLMMIDVFVGNIKIYYLTLFTFSKTYLTIKNHAKD